MIKICLRGSTEENLAWLRKHQCFYVVSARQSALTLELDGELVPVGDAQDFVKAALLKSPDDNEEKWLYCESEAKAAVASEMKRIQRIEIPRLLLCILGC